MLAAEKGKLRFLSIRARPGPSVGGLEHHAQVLNPVTQHWMIQGKGAAPLLCFAFARCCRDIHLVLSSWSQFILSVLV